MPETFANISWGEGSAKERRKERKRRVVPIFERYRGGSPPFQGVESGSDRRISSSYVFIRGGAIETSRAVKVENGDTQSVKGNDFVSSSTINIQSVLRVFIFISTTTNFVQGDFLSRVRVRARVSRIRIRSGGGFFVDGAARSKSSET